MGYSDNKGIQILHRVLTCKLYAVKPLRLLCIRRLVHNNRINPILTKLLHNIDHLCISGIRAVLLKGEAQNSNPGRFYRYIGFNQVLYHIFGHISAHIVIDTAPGQNDLGMITQFLRLVGEIIRIHADTVASNQAREERKEIPFCPRRIQYGLGIDAQLVKNNGKFVHKSDINISLTVFNYLGRFRHLDGIGTVYSGFHHQLIYFCNGIQRLFIHAGYYLHDRLQTMHLVPGVDTLRGIAHLKINPAFQARFLFHNGNTDFLGYSGIYGGFEHHDASLHQITSHGTAGALHRTQIRRMILIYRCGDSNDMEFRFLQLRFIGCEFHICLPDHIVSHLSGRIISRFILLHLLRIQIIADNIDFSAESYRNGHTHIA